MKNIIPLFFLFILTLSACKKENQIDSALPSKEPITVDEAIAWLSKQSDTSDYIKKYAIKSSNARSVATNNGNRIVIALAGNLTFQNFKQGYRQLSIQKNTDSHQIEARFLEIIPDALYFQSKQKVSPIDFTGRIIEYDLSYNLLAGKIYANGKHIGDTRPATLAEKSAYIENKDALRPIGNFEQLPTVNNSNDKIALARVIEHCEWLQTSYVDADGKLVIHSERFCTTYVYDDGGGGDYNDGGIGIDPPSDPPGNGGGGSSGTTGPPPPSNLPGENNNNVDPKKMVECFGNIPSSGAAFQVKILVIEPLPGTFFNVGPNSFGHTAIQLTKVNGSKSVTQNIGFYPTGNGFDKLVSNSTIKDNGDIAYSMDASYFTNADDFQKILNYISNPPKNYHYTDFNCAAFAYYAAKAGNLPVPSPLTGVGLNPSGTPITYAMTPAGWGSALRTEKAANPKANINEAGGTAPPSKGECKEVH